MTARCRVSMQIVTMVSGLALLAGSAFAQSSSSSGSGSIGSPGPAPLSAPASTVKPRPPAPNPLKMEDISNIKGTVVYGSDEKKIGTVSTVLMKPDSKMIDRFVVGEGGVLGVGSHYVALPVDAFSWDAQKEAFTIAKTGDDLKSMPEWREQLSEASDSEPAARSGTGSAGTTPSIGGPASTAPSR